MSQQSLEEEVLEILRQRSMAGSTRDVSLDQQLGEAGLGLDSLGLVQFVSSLEKRFEIEFPEDIWFDKGLLTIRDFVKIIRQSQGGKAKPSYSSIDETLATLPVNTPYFRRISEIFKQAGLARGIHWIWKRGIQKIQTLFYESVNHVILLRDLTKELPSIASHQDGLSIRETPFLSDDAVADLWPPRHRRAMLRMTRRYAREGYICLTAWMGNEIVGIDWLSLSGHHDTSTGLEIKTKEGCCAAMNLYEKYRGKGIGLALLASSLQEGRERGCTSQVTVVQDANMPMLSVATQLFGFTQVGSIRTHRFLGWTASTWKKNGQEYGTRTVTLPFIAMALEGWSFLQSVPSEISSLLL